MTHAVGLSGWLDGALEQQPLMLHATRLLAMGLLDALLDGALEPQPLMLHATRLLAMGLLDALLDVAARWCT